jgi:conjugative transfer signal peptidase TraF
MSPSVVVVRPSQNWLATGFLLLCMTPLLAQAAALQFVYTPSVPRGIYMTHAVEERPLRRGDYVCLEAWRPSAPAAIREAARNGQVPRSWVEGERLTKRVAGVAGDRIGYVSDVDGGHVTVNGKPLPTSTALLHDSAGGKLARPPYPYVLRRGEVWLTSEHARGFDSRYFGAVPLSALGCRAELLWRW